MPDDKSSTDGADRKRINADEDYEVQYWCEKFSVSREELRAAVQKVGPMADDVAEALGKSQ